MRAGRRPNDDHLLIGNIGNVACGFVLVGVVETAAEGGHIEEWRDDGLSTESPRGEDNMARSEFECATRCLGFNLIALLTFDVLDAGDFGIEEYVEVHGLCVFVHEIGDLIAAKKLG